jgi:hypothetical protein
MDFYRPDAVVIEDHQAKDCRRLLRTRTLLRDIGILASGKKVRVRKVSRLAVSKVFASERASTKHRIALEIAKSFPELESYLPSTRNAWMSEDLRMSMFTAVALALTIFYLPKLKYSRA